MNETVRIKLESLRSQYDALTAQMGEPDVAANYEKMAQLVRERTLIAPVVDLMSEYENHAHTLADAQRILSEEDQEQNTRMTQSGQFIYILQGAKNVPSVLF